MTIYFNPATEKYPAKLNVNFDKLTATDVIGIQEAIVVCNNNSIDFLLILSDECAGIESRDKSFKASGSKCRLSFFKDKKQQWNTDEKKFVDVAVSQDENYLFTILSAYVAENSASGYSGRILPWVNPFFWELVKQQTESSLEMADGMIRKMYSLMAAELRLITEDDKTALLATTNTGNKGGGASYSKAESEAEKLASRLHFLKLQLTPLIGDFKSIGELYLMIPGLDEGIKLAVERTVEISIKLMGGK